MSALLLITVPDALHAIPVAAVAGALTSLGLTVTATSFVAIAITAALNLGIGLLVTKLLAPKQKTNNQASATTLQLGEQPRQALFGRVATAGSLADAWNAQGKYGTDWEYVVFAIADHRCQALVGVYVDDQYIPYEAWTSGLVPGFNNQLAIHWCDGTQTAPTADMTSFGGYDAADCLTGVAFAQVAYKADAAGAKNPVWPAGRPGFLFVVDGKLCYDPRKDATVAGGVGAHRWADPSTWEWSDDPIVCRYNWARGVYALDQVGSPDQLLVGRGLSAQEAPPENVAAYANVCDEAVPVKYLLSGLAAGAGVGATTIALESVAGLSSGMTITIDAGGGIAETRTVTSVSGLVVGFSGGLVYSHDALASVRWTATTGAEPTEKRYRVGAIVNSTDTFITVEEKFAAACAGMIIQVDGSVEVEPGQAKAPVATITDDDIIVLTSIKFAKFRSEADDAWCNTVVPAYVEPSQKWSQHGAPVRRVVADLVADGGPRENDLTLDYVTSGTQAQRCGEITRRLGRLTMTAAMTLGPRFAGLEEGDWIVWNSARRGSWTCRVESFALDQKWQNTLSLRAIADTCFTWSPADEGEDGATANQQPRPPALDQPGATAWTFAGAVLSGLGAALPVLNFTGAVDDDYAEAILFEYRVHDGSDPAAASDWVSAPLAPTSTTRFPIATVASGGEYDGAVSYIIMGEPGPRRILGPVTAGQLGFASGAHRLISQSIDYPITSDDTSITIASFTAIDDSGAAFTFAGATIASLASGTSYGVFWNIAAGDYEAEAAPADTRMASAAYVFLGWQATSTSGSYSAPPPAPGGYGGSGVRPRAAAL